MSFPEEEKDTTDMDDESEEDGYTEISVNTAKIWIGTCMRPTNHDMETTQGDDRNGELRRKRVQCSRY